MLKENLKNFKEKSKKIGICSAVAVPTFLASVTAFAAEGDPATVDTAVVAINEAMSNGATLIQTSITAGIVAVIGTLMAIFVVKNLPTMVMGFISKLVKKN